MAETEKEQTVTIRIFGFLQRYMDEQGLPYNLERDIPGEGCTAHDIARKISIPPEKIEAVFCNGGVINIYDTIFPGDRVGFFPHGTPGPYRVFLGIARENRERSRREKKIDVKRKTKDLN